MSNQNLADNWVRLEDLATQHCPELHSILVTYKDTELLARPDGLSISYPGMYDAPASVAAHHNYQGGLVEHYLEMWDLYVSLTSEYSVLSTDELPGDYIHRKDLVLLAIVVHDLHKARYNYRHKPVFVDQVMTGYDYERFDYSEHPEYEMLTKTQRNIQMAAVANVHLPLIVANAVSNSEGGYVVERTKHVTPFAKLLYLLDEMSANVVNRIKRGRIIHYKQETSQPDLGALGQTVGDQDPSAICKRV